MIKVLITEDSPVVRGYLQHILNSDPDIQVVGTAQDGEEAVKMAAQTEPEVLKPPVKSWKHIQYPLLL